MNKKQKYLSWLLMLLYPLNFFFILLILLLFTPGETIEAAVPAVFTNALENIKNVAISIGGTMLVVGFIVAGILYLTSGGSPEKLATAKKALVAAIIGGIITVLAITADKIQDIIKEILGI